MTPKTTLKLLHSLTSIILAAVLILCPMLLASCADPQPPLTDGDGTGKAPGSGETTDGNNGDNIDKDDSLIIARDGATNYTIVRPDNAKAALVSATAELRKYLVDEFSTAPKITDDWVKSGTDPNTISEYEILIGHTNRDPSAAALEEVGTGGWSVTVSGNKIIINSARESDIGEPIEYFKSILKFEDGILKMNKNDVKTENREAPPDTVLRVGSYNIKTGSQVNYNLKLIAEDITGMKLDVVGLQEIDQLTNRNGKIDTMKTLSQLTGYEYYKFAKAISYQGGEYGVGILSRYPIDSFEVIKLYSGGKEQRVLSHAVIDINGVKVDFFNTHLSYESKDIRTEQFKAVAEKLSECKNFILTGDFNTSDTAEFTVIEKSFLVNPKKYVTFPGSNSHIDNIVLSENWVVTDSGTLEKGHSDHSMLWAEIKLEG